MIFRIKNYFVLIVVLVGLSACLDEDVSTLYLYQGKFICDGVVADDLEGMSHCFDPKKYRSLIFKPQRGTDEKTIARLMNALSSKTKDRIKMINYIMEDEKEILDPILKNHLKNSNNAKKS